MTVLSAGAMILFAFVALLGLGLVAGVAWIAWRLVKLLFQLVLRALGFVRRELGDAIHAAGALATAACTIPLAVANLVILRLGSARHYGRAFLDELKGVGVGLWRVALGNPLRFLGLGALVSGIEERLPDAMERAPRRRARRATFDGYDVIGTLPSGGSGAQLFVARPRTATQRRFLAAGRALPAEVVIKSFALESGSTLPQIVRESRALEAASRLGLVCEHQLTNDHFYYVMPYVKGEDLERVTRALHARGTPEGLADAELALVLRYAIDLLDSLQRFHSGGLWHKDVKPANVIVAKGRAHLVDFGLVTPLASALTLTTHGTEYYRDPEMVRLAMQGVKVHEVDGVRFDVYSAGAVLFSLLENGFPAHGNLSRLTKRAPEALRWIVQRAMAEMHSRYGSAAEMRADLAVLASATNAFDVRPADLPSFQRAAVPGAEPLPVVPFLAGSAPRPEPLPAPELVPLAGTHGSRRRLRPRLAVAAGVVGLVAFTTLSSERSRHAAAVHRVEAVVARASARVGSAPAPSWSSLNERERRVLALAQGVAADLHVDDEPLAAPAEALLGTTGMQSAHEALAVPAPADDPPVAALPAHGRVLVLEDVTTGVEERVLALLRAKLRERSFRVVGEEQDEHAAAEAVEMLASARHALGLGRADEPEAQAALQRFLEDSADLAGLIVVSRADGDGAEHVYRVFVRSR